MQSARRSTRSRNIANGWKFYYDLVFVHFKRARARFVSLHRYRENGKRRDASGSSLEASKSRFHYRRSTLGAAASYCTLYSTRYADAVPHYAILNSTQICINCENFGEQVCSLLSPIAFSTLLYLRWFIKSFSIRCPARKTNLTQYGIIWFSVMFEWNSNQATKNP